MIREDVNWQPSDLTNELIKLKPLEQDDFEQLYQVASDPLIWEQHPSNDRYLRPVFRGFFAEAMASGTAFMIVNAVSGEAIGSTRFYNHDPELRTIAIGYTFLARKYWGGAYNRAAKKLLLNYSFQYVDQVLFHIGSGNLRSQLAIGKLGGKKVKEEYRDRNGVPQLHFEYALLKQNWEEHR